MLSGLFSLKLTFERSKSESLCDVSVTIIGDTFSYGFPQTVLVFNSYLFLERTFDKSLSSPIFYSNRSPV